MDYVPNSQRVVVIVFLQSCVYTWILLVAVRIQLVLLFLEVPKIRDIRVSKEPDLEVLDRYDTPELLRISVSNRTVCIYLKKNCECVCLKSESMRYVPKQ